MISFLKLIRYKNLLMFLLTMVLTKYALISSYVEPSLSNIEFLIFISSVLLIASGGYIINDIYDIEVDRINKPNKLFIGESISVRNAWISYVILTVLGILFGVLISYKKHLFDHSFYFVATALGLFLYSKFLKRLPLIGNLLISILVSLVIFLIYDIDYKLAIKRDVFTNLSLLIVVFYYIIFSFLATLIREIIKDVEDIDGDYNLRMKTFPIIFGKARTKNLAIILMGILLVFLILLLKEPFLLTSYTFLVGVLIEIGLILYTINKLWNAKTKKQFHFLSNLMKLIMLLGILSMGLFKFM